MVILIGMAILNPSDVNDTYQWLILIGLVFSIGGDVFLMLPERYFLYGLASFLTAHVVYIGAFAFTGDGALHWGIFIALVGYGIFIGRILWPHLGEMRWPVMAYITVILAMVWMALGRWVINEPSNAALAGIGAMLFAVSDTALALNRFRRPYRAAQLIIMTTYYLAQALIALSI